MWHRFTLLCFLCGQVSGIHWWYKTASHAAELGAGFYNTAHRDGYLPIAQMLSKHNAAFNFTCVELSTLAQEEGYPEALADPEGLVWQVRRGTVTRRVTRAIMYSALMSMSGWSFA